ncbi:MAG: diguanylate cyclase [Nitrospirota bacterium]
MLRRWLSRLNEMTLRSKLIAAFVGWTCFVLVVTAGYVVARFGALTDVLASFGQMQPREALNAVVWLAGVLALATMVFVWVVSRDILRPIAALASAVRGMKPGSSHIPLPPLVTRDRDLWELTQAFDHMSFALAEREATVQQTLRDRDRQLHELAMIARFVEGCARFQEGDELYRHLTTHIAEAVEADICFLVQYDKHTNEMAAQRPGHGVRDDQLAAVRYPVTPEIRSAWDFKSQGVLLCNDPQSDQRILRELIRPLGLYNLVAVPFSYQGRVSGLIVVANKPKWVTHEDGRLLSVFANHAAMAIANLSFYQEIQQLAIRDGLTGLHNYRYFRQQIARTVQHARRYESPLSLLMIDLDNFKRYNDAYGHLKGDHILKEVAALLLAYTRSADLVARYGGEEFVVLLPEIDEEQAHRVAEKIRQVVEAHPFTLAAGELPQSLTISVGVASSIGEWSADMLIQTADDALYRAKASGKNRVVASNASSS